MAANKIYVYARTEDGKSTDSTHLERYRGELESTLPVVGWKTDEPMADRLQLLSIIAIKASRVDAGGHGLEVDWDAMEFHDVGSGGTGWVKDSDHAVRFLVNDKTEKEVVGAVVVSFTEHEERRASTQSKAKGGK